MIGYELVVKSLTIINSNGFSYGIKRKKDILLVLFYSDLYQYFYVQTFEFEQFELA